MKNRINVAELLKECPKGMELDCTMFENVTFIRVDMSRKQFPIEIAISGIHIKYLTKEGCFHDTTLLPESKCVIFPKGKTTWEGFVPPVEFKDGDIVAFDDDDGNTLLFIYKEIIDANEGYSVCYLMIDYDGGLDLVEGDYYINRLATEEEKQKLFKTIKDNGYKWNEETKTLEKLIEPRFKVGDRIRHKEEPKWTCVIRRIDDRYWVDEHPMCYTLPFGKQDEYELVPDKFDITTLKPFDKILVRDADNGMWIAALFSHLREMRFYTVSTWYNQCIPFENNEHLLGKTDDCDEFYKTWTNEEE